MSHRRVPVADLCRWGRDLHRPECVLTTARGDVFVPDWRGGVTAIRMNGNQETWLAKDAESWLRPNGIALVDDGCFLVANLGDNGGIWRLDRDRTLTPFLEEVDGMRVPPANFVTTDVAGRTWISVSTRHVRRTEAWRPDVHDGFVIVIDDRGARIVADGLHYTNEVRVDPSGEWLYIVETFGRRVSRARIGANGSLGRLESAVELGTGYFPDGFAFDTSGGLWVTSLVSNRLVRVADDRVQVVIEDLNAGALADAEAAFANGTLQREHLGPIAGTELQQLTSVAFGGPDRREVFLGNLHSPWLHRFRGDFAGI